MQNETTSTIDITPTWVELLPALIAVIQNGAPESRNVAIMELRRALEVVDRLNAEEGAAAAARLAARNNA